MCWDMSTPSFRLQTPSTLTQGMRLGRALTQGPATPTKENIVQHGISSVKHALSPIAEGVGKALGNLAQAAGLGKDEAVGGAKDAVDATKKVRPRTEVHAFAAKKCGRCASFKGHAMVAPCQTLNHPIRTQFHRCGEAA